MGEIVKKKKNIRRYFIIFIIIVLTFIYMIPLLYVVTTSFKSWSDVQKVPPTYTFKPSIAAYIRIFTSRVVYSAGNKPTEEEIEEMKWYERIVYEETGEKIVRIGDLPRRYLNSTIILENVGYGIEKIETEEGGGIQSSFNHLVCNVGRSPHIRLYHDVVDDGFFFFPLLTGEQKFIQCVICPG